VHRDLRTSLKFLLALRCGSVEIHVGNSEYIDDFELHADWIDVLARVASTCSKSSPGPSWYSNGIMPAAAKAPAPKPAVEECEEVGSFGD